MRRTFREIPSVLNVAGRVHALVVMFDGPTERARVCGFETYDYLDEEGIIPPQPEVEKPEERPVSPKKKSNLKYTRIKRL